MFASRCEIRTVFIKPDGDHPKWLLLKKTILNVANKWTKKLHQLVRSAKKHKIIYLERNYNWCWQIRGDALIAMSECKLTQHSAFLVFDAQQRDAGMSSSGGPLAAPAPNFSLYSADQSPGGANAACSLHSHKHNEHLCPLLAFWPLVCAHLHS